jgi:hypothetical protein
MELHVRDRERSCFVDSLSSPFVRAPMILLVAGGASLLLAGCGPKRVRADFTHYESSYAVTSNHEELLNLARLQQHDPTYFFKLGQISSSYRMEAALTGTGQVSTITNPPASIIPTGGGSPGLIYENDPSFTMIPVSDDTNARILMQPTSSQVFYSLYLQGWRLDQLFRLTVNRIEFTLPTAQGCQVKIIRNLPPPAVDGPDYTNDQFSMASYIEFLRVSAVIYALQKHGLLLLRATPSFQALDPNSFIANKTSSAKTPPAGDPPSANGDAGAKSPSGAGPTAKDFDEVAAKGQGQVWELQGADPKTGDGGNWFLGTNSIEPKFQLTDHIEQSSADAGYVLEPKKYGQNVAAIEQELLTDFQKPGNGMEAMLFPKDKYGNYIGGPDLTEILEIIYNGFTIEESSSEQDSERRLCLDSAGNPANRISAHLVMRSLIGLMGAAAQEQDSFDKLEENNPDLAKGITDPTMPTGALKEIATFVTDFYTAAYKATTGGDPGPKDMKDKQGQLVSQLQQNGAHFNDLVPKIEQLPVLKLMWTDAELDDAYDSEAELEKLGLAVHYKNPENDQSEKEHYAITDWRLDKLLVPENKYWNRDMFRLINQLSSQVTVDLSKYPLPEILQLRTE